ncbi:MAG: FlgD immunoglobulin-like domain containing protein [Candidatus Hatepunaea meridiana]|nr:FlgD immunoglobulin-like domain containing protein [Candidatus Hatepunaea meridiana]
MLGLLNAEVTRTEALQIVMNDVVGEDDEDVVDVWSDPNEILSNTDFLISTGGTVTSPEIISWFFFVDYWPQSNWGHLCKYVFVKKATGSYCSYERGCWYDPTTSVDPEDCILEVEADKNENEDTFVSKLEQPGPGRDDEHLFAILFNGGVRPINNDVHNWNDISAMYCTLNQKYDFPQENIIVLNSDGPDAPEWDRKHMGRVINSSPEDLDNDEDNDINYSGTRENLYRVLDDLAEELDQDDLLFIYTVDHGEYWGINKRVDQRHDPPQSIEPWFGDVPHNERSHNDRIWVDDFRDEVNEINFGHLICIFDQCYSGAFSEAMSDLDNTIVISAAENDAPSAFRVNRENPDCQYNEFSYHFIAALRGCYPGAHSYEEGNREADANLNDDFNDDDDPIISIWEASSYAYSNDFFHNNRIGGLIIDNPQYYSNSKGLGELCTPSGPISGHILSLSIGWNFVSTNHLPTNDGRALNVILNRLVTKINGNTLDIIDWPRDPEIIGYTSLMIIKDEQNRSYVPDDDPPEWVWETDEGGYLIKVTSDEEIGIPGPLIPEEDYDDWLIDLDENAEEHPWDNYIAYLPDEPRDIEVVFDEIDDINNLALVKDGDGNFYIPEWEYNGIGNMEVGQGYHVIMYHNDQLVYTASQRKAIVASCNTDYFDFIRRTGSNHAIIVENISLDDIEIEEGDELAAFTPDGLCCGGVVCHGSFPLIFAAWRDDETTEEMDGYLPGQEIIFIFWDRSENRVITTETNTDSWRNGTVTSFSDYPYSVVNIGSSEKTLKPSIPHKFKLLANYPNPFNASTRIRFNLADAGRVRVIVFDQLGHNVRTLLNRQVPAGHHSFSWDGTDRNGIPVNSGMYFCRVNAGDNNDIVKMVLAK